MGETESNIKIFVKSDEEFVFFEEMTNQEFSEFCLNESDKIIKELRINELNSSYSKFLDELKIVLHNIKLSIYFVSESKSPFSKVLLSTLSGVKGQIKQYFGSKFSDLINWHEPSYIDKYFRNDVLPKINNNSDFSNYLSRNNIVKNNNGIISLGKTPKPILPREEIFKKLIDRTKNIEKFKKIEKILIKEEYLNKDLEWIKNPADLIRFYNYIEEKKIIKNTFEDSKGVKYLRDLFNFQSGNSIDSRSKRELQNAGNYRQFHKILD